MDKLQVNGKEKRKIKQSQRKRMKEIMFTILSCIVICIIISIFVIIPPSSSKIKPYIDEDGNIIEGSIAEKIFVKINGIKQGMIIKGKSINNPLLLFLSGGPGIPEYWMAYEYPTELEEHFTVCYWSYRGTALSYNSDCSSETMTTEQFLSDATEVTNYLCKRFGQDKIYLMAHSFGTYIGIQLAEQHPELYKAYIAMSQNANQYQSEYLAYTYMMEQYQKIGNESMVKKFKKYNIFTLNNTKWSMTDDIVQDYFVSLRDTAMHELGVGTTHNMKSVITGIFLPTLQMTEFTPLERINIWRGKAFSSNTPVVQDSFNFNAFNEVCTLEIPIYIFAGIYDYTCCYSVQKDFYEQLEAPIKGFYTFTESAHSPLFEEPKHAIEIMVNDVLNQIVSMDDENCNI